MDKNFFKIAVEVNTRRLKRSSEGFHDRKTFRCESSHEEAPASSPSLLLMDSTPTQFSNNDNSDNNESEDDFCHRGRFQEGRYFERTATFGSFYPKYDLMKDSNTSSQLNRWSVQFSDSQLENKFDDYTFNLIKSKLQFLGSTNIVLTVFWSLATIVSALFTHHQFNLFKDSLQFIYFCCQLTFIFLCYCRFSTFDSCRLTSLPVIILLQLLVLESLSTKLFSDGSLLSSSAVVSYFHFGSTVVAFAMIAPCKFKTTLPTDITTLCSSALFVLLPLLIQKDNTYIARSPLPSLSIRLSLFLALLFLLALRVQRELLERYGFLMKISGHNFSHRLSLQPREKALGDMIDAVIALEKLSDNVITYERPVSPAPARTKAEIVLELIERCWAKVDEVAKQWSKVRSALAAGSATAEIAEAVGFTATFLAYNRDVLDKVTETVLLGPDMFQVIETDPTLSQFDNGRKKMLEDHILKKLSAVFTEPEGRMSNRRATLMSQGESLHEDSSVSSDAPRDSTGIPISHAIQPIDTDFIAKLGVDMELNFVCKSILSIARPLASIGRYLLLPYASSIGLNDMIVDEFLSRLEDFYLSNPYHNSLHGTSVAHQGLTLLRAFSLHEEAQSFGNLEILTFIISCLGHDAGHPGRTTTFLRKTRDPLNLLYNDRAPLESMHASLVLSILEGSTSNLFCNVDPHDVTDLRKRMLELILATDMSLSDQITANFRIRCLDNRFDPHSSNEDAWKLCEMCIKSADLGHSVLPLGQHIQWSYRVLEEFYQQQEEEDALGIATLPLFLRNEHELQFVSTQYYFLNRFSRPVWTALLSYDDQNPRVENSVKRLYKNLHHWEKESQAKKEGANERRYTMPSFLKERYKTRGSAALQPILDMEYILIKRLRLHGRTELRLPGEPEHDSYLARKRRISEVGTQEELLFATLPSSSLELTSAEASPELQPTAELLPKVFMKRGSTTTTFSQLGNTPRFRESVTELAPLMRRSKAFDSAT